MSELYAHILAAVRDGTGLVYLDVQPPRDAPRKQFVASFWEHAPSDQGQLRPSGGPTSTVAVTPDQARELLAAGAEWKGPAHLRTEVLPGA